MVRITTAPRATDHAHFQRGLVVIASERLAHLQCRLVVLHAFTVSFTHSQCSLVVVTDDSVVVYLAQLQRGFVVVHTSSGCKTTLTHF